MRIQIVYHTLSLNTKLLAETLHEHLSENHEATINDISDPVDYDDVELVFVGSPCHDSDLAVAVKRYLEGIPENAGFKLAGFYCHSSFKRDAPHPTAEAMFDKWAAKGISSFYELAEEKGVELLGVFNCMGVPSPDILTFIKMEIITDEAEQKVYESVIEGHPDSADLEDLRQFADQIIERV